MVVFLLDCKIERTILLLYCNDNKYEGGQYTGRIACVYCQLLGLEISTLAIFITGKTRETRPRQVLGVKKHRSSIEVFIVITEQLLIDR